MTLPAGTLRLAVVIPCHNDADTLTPLLARLAALGPVAEVVVIDDGSATPLRSDQLLADAGLTDALPHADWLRIIRHVEPLGAGAARNAGITLVTAPHLLFLDADDMVMPDLAHLCRDLVGRHFDFCIFQHHDTRNDRHNILGQMHFDQRLWQQAGLSLGALSQADRRQAALLAQTANYPWNKIYRTAYLRDHSIGCSPLPVHNDVELHWRSFLLAQQILASDRICVSHVVRDQGDRLTNRQTAERLQILGPMTRIAQEIRLHPDCGLEQAFHRFSWGLFDWMQPNLPPDSRPQLRRQAAAFWAASTPAKLRHSLRAEHRDLLARLGIR